MLTTIALLSALGVISMMIQDASGTILTIAENRGKYRLAGIMDMAGDAAKFVMYAYSGTQLMTDYGWWGRLGILPILMSSYFTTSKVTKYANSRIVDNADVKVAELEKRIQELEVRVNG